MTDAMENGIDPSIETTRPRRDSKRSRRKNRTRHVNTLSGTQNTDVNRPIKRALSNGPVAVGHAKAVALASVRDVKASAAADFFIEDLSQ
jgi:hypothetical protein